MLDIVKGQPLKLPDGTVVLPDVDASGSRLLSADEVADNEQAEEVERELDNLLVDPINNDYSSLYKRTLADVTHEPSRMNVVMLVVAYTMWGLDSYAISRLLNVTPEQIETLQMSDLYSNTQKQLVEAVRYAEAATVHGYLTSKSHDAARVIATELKSRSADARLAAAKDILDRSGFRPADRVEHTHRFEDELRIRYIQDDAGVPVVDITLENDDGNGS